MILGECKRKKKQIQKLRKNPNMEQNKANYNILYTHASF